MHIVWDDVGWWIFRAPILTQRGWAFPVEAAEEATDREIHNAIVEADLFGEVEGDVTIHRDGLASSVIFVGDEAQATTMALGVAP